MSATRSEQRDASPTIAPTGRLAVVTGTNPRATALLDRSSSTSVDIDGTSVTVLEGEADGLVVLDRHGIDHARPAHLVDHIANMKALAALGCDRVVAIASTGSLRLDWPVGTVVAPDDFFAPWASPSLFADLRGHRVPGFDRSWRHTLVQAWRAAENSPLVDGGIYAQMRGPRFETRAEIRFLAAMADVVGMTLASECIIAGEVGLRYAAVCVVDNLANGVGERPLTIDEFEAGVAANGERLAADVAALVSVLESPGS
jgi:5'-methylthioadenosine phosphorylase